MFYVPHKRRFEVKGGEELEEKHKQKEKAREEINGFLKEEIYLFQFFLKLIVNFL